MNENTILKQSIEINTKSSNVWVALTSPEWIKKYLFGTDAISDWKVGSPIIFQGEWEGKKYSDKGTILKFEKNKNFQYNYWSNFSGFEDKPENYTRIAFELSEINNKTVLTLIQDHFVTQLQYEHSSKNWKMILDSIKKMLEG